MADARHPAPASAIGEKHDHEIERLPHCPSPWSVMGDKTITLAEAQARDWRVRALVRAKWETTPMGAALLAMMGRRRQSLPRLGDSAMIRPDGMVTTTMIDASLIIHNGYEVCTIDQLRTFLAGIADECNLADDEIEHLFYMARQWIKFDLSGKADLNYEAKTKATLQ